MFVGCVCGFVFETIIMAVAACGAVAAWVSDSLVKGKV